jgi:hypothetical protein
MPGLELPLFKMWVRRFEMTDMQIHNLQNISFIPLHGFSIISTQRLTIWFGIIFGRSASDSA